MMGAMAAGARATGTRAWLLHNQRYAREARIDAHPASALPRADPLGSRSPYCLSLRVPPDFVRGPIALGYYTASAAAFVTRLMTLLLASKFVPMFRRLGAEKRIWASPSRA
jgi:hypothetical protein